MRKEIMIKIPLSRYEQLVVVEARAALLADLVQTETYVGREDVADYLGVDIPEPDAKEELSFTEMLGDHS